MAEALCKYKGLAPWVGMVVTVLSGIVLNVAVISYSYGQLQQRQMDIDHRLSLIEANDREQGKQIGQATDRLARIEEGVVYIRDTLKEHQKKTEKQ